MKVFVCPKCGGEVDYLGTLTLAPIREHNPRIAIDLWVCQPCDQTLDATQLAPRGDAPDDTRARPRALSTRGVL